MSYRTGTVSSHPGLPGFRRTLLTPSICALTLLSLLFGVAFIRLGGEVHESETLPTDQRVLHTIDDHTASWPVAIPDDVSLLASEAVTGAVGAALAGWLFLHRRRLDALLFLGAVGGYVALTLVVKHLVQRERPVSFFRVPESGYGFPSGHTLGAICLAFALGFILWRGTARPVVKALASAALILVVVAIALSRLILGVHYPTDVLGSILLGTAWMSGLIALRYAAERWLLVRAARLPAAG